MYSIVAHSLTYSQLYDIVKVEEKEETMRFFDNRTNHGTFFVLLVSGLMFSACGGKKPTTPVTDGGPVPGMDSGPNVCTRNCDDGIACTDDSLNTATCLCTNIPLDSRCSGGDICLPEEGGCTSAPSCVDVDDCPKPNQKCRTIKCDLATSTCRYPLLDRDGDGHSPKNADCVPLGGDDCDDTPPGFYKNCNPEQPCVPSENDYDCQSCQMGELTHPGATELCDYKDNDCNGVADDNPMIGTLCDSYWDSDLCEDGVLDCLYDLDGGEFDSLRCSDDTASNQEICDGLDNDCDGEVDEDWPELGDNCDGNDTDYCPEGVYVCDSAESGTICTDTTSSTLEICDELDNDCDGLTDENLLNACGTCEPLPQEICDGQDNDCDDLVDELPSECTNNSDIACIDGNSIECVCCDGLDNDDDGLTDTTDPDCIGIDFWCPITQDGAPSARYGHTAVWTGTEMIVWGGSSGEQVLDDGGRYNPATDTWSSLNEAGAPEPRHYHTAVWTGNEMIIWGGYSSTNEYLNTGGRYNPMNNTWLPTSTDNAPSPRIQHTATWIGTEMIVMGGEGIINQWGTVGVFADAWSYNPENNSWTQLFTLYSWNGRRAHTAVWTGNYLLIWGGSGINSGPSSDLNTGLIYEPATQFLYSINTIGAPSARGNHTAVWIGAKMLIFGGICWGGWGCNNFSGGQYYFPGDYWGTPIPGGGTTGHTAIWTGTEMIIWGGWSGGNGNSAFNPDSNMWRALPQAAAPIASSGHTAIWTSESMIIWGGWYWGEGTTTIDTNTGGRYFLPP